MANKKYLERLKLAVEHLHDCRATWVRSEPVHEVVRGETIWKGFVEVFGLKDHPKATWAYGWGHPEDSKDDEKRFVTVLVLEIPPVDSPQTAVQAAIAIKVPREP